MTLAPFALERFFAAHEFTTPHILCASDCEPLTLAETLALATPTAQALWRELSLGYTESAGHPLLRAEIATLYGSLVPGDTLVLAPEEGIYLAMQALLAPGDHAVCMFPGYQSLYAVAEARGCEVSRWEPRFMGDRWHFDLDDLRALLRDDTRLLIVNLPHNPTGALLSLADWEQLLALCAARELPLFSDEMYRGLERDPAARLPAACVRYERAITLSGLSKSLSTPGLRLGWLATRDAALLARCAALKDYTTICSSAPSEVLALMVLQSRDRLVTANRALIAANRALLDAFFAAHRDLFLWPPPQAGSVAFPQYLATGRAGTASADGADGFCRATREEAGVLLAPGSLWGYPRHFRVGLGRRNAPAAIDQLAVWLEGRVR
jgi:aspartate/methionine/tyrosine aminotransferase